MRQKLDDRACKGDREEWTDIGTLFRLSRGQNVRNGLRIKLLGGCSVSLDHTVAISNLTIIMDVS